MTRLFAFVIALLALSLGTAAKAQPPAPDKSLPQATPQAALQETPFVVTVQAATAPGFLPARACAPCGRVRKEVVVHKYKRRVRSQ